MASRVAALVMTDKDRIWVGLDLLETEVFAGRVVICAMAETERKKRGNGGKSKSASRRLIEAYSFELRMCLGSSPSLRFMLPYVHVSRVSTQSFHNPSLGKRSVHRRIMTDLIFAFLTLDGSLDGLL